jgi:subtilisin family serine protease
LAGGTRTLQLKITDQADDATSREMRVLEAAMIVRSIVLAGTVVAGSLGGPAFASQDPAVPGLIVRYSPGVGATDARGVPLGADRVRGARLLSGHRIGFGLRTVKFTQPLSLTAAQAAARQYARTPGVLSVEPDLPVQAAETLTQSGATWGLDRIDQRALPLSTTYSYDNAGQGVTAYIVDTGILGSHTEFAGRVTAGFSAISDGYATTDRNGHGTHVAGTVGSTRYGVAKAVTLVPVRVLDAKGSGSTSGVISGLNWIVNNHPAGVPAVANMSLGGGASSALDSAVNAVINDGVTMVVASGNSSANSCNYSPARVPAAITVNASTSTDARATFSNYGSCSDLYAPGQNITSAWHTSPTATSTISGTSMATPHVAGAAARVLGANPTWTPAQVWASMNAAATAVTFGKAASGDPDKLLYVPSGPVTAAPPSAPTSVKAVRGPGSATVTWGAPLASGGSPVTAYEASAWNAPSGGTQIARCSGTAISRSCTLTGLTNGVTYYVDVTANNASGTGPASTPRVTVTPASAPTAPLAVRATGSSNKIGTAWSIPTSTGGMPITGYTARAWSVSSGGTSPVRTCTTKTTACDIRNLTRGKEYYVDVVATNAVGTGSASSPRVAVRL